MLGKLLKYEIPAVGRKLAPMYLAWLAASVLLGLTMGRFDGSFAFMIIPPLVYFGVTVAVFVMAIILIIQRYYNSLLGDEAYFNQVLPVTAGEHIASKTLSAFIWMALTMLAALLSGIIILLLTGGTGAFWNGQPLDFSELWNAISNYPNSGKVILLIAEFLALAVLSFLKSVLAVYAAITIGHLVRNHVVLASIGAYIGLMIFESSVGNIFISLGLTTGENTDLNTLFSSNFAATQMLVGVSFLISVALIAIYFFICKYIMENKLNLA